MNIDLSPNTKVSLLLTSPLIIGGHKRGREDSLRLLTFSEYGQLATRLRTCDRQLGDLMAPGATEILAECQVNLDNTRVTQLLRRGFQLSQALEHWGARAIWVASHEDSYYPAQIKRRLGGIAPPVIYGCGDRTLLENGGLAVVGSRNASNGPIEYAERIGQMAARAQCTVVSGGARGVDQAGMRGALYQGGTAVGVLADSLERAVMHRENRDMLMEHRLTLISPYDPRAGFSAGNAMRRNKLIYALADAGLVIDAAYDKGGTWAGAVEQLDKMRMVPIYVRADGGNNKALLALARRGARSWPDPQTPEDLRLALSAHQLYSETEAQWRNTFLPDSVDVIKSPNSTTAQVTEPQIPQDMGASVRDTSPSEALLAKVEELLLSIETPTTESDVASYLNVSRNQAREWLKRLVLQGKYERSKRPVRYIRGQ